MKIFCVVTEKDGATTREPGKVSTAITRIERRYAAETIYDVWDEVEKLPLEEYDEALIAVYEEHASVTVLDKNRLT